MGLMQTSFRASDPAAKAQAEAAARFLEGVHGVRFVAILEAGYWRAWAV